ncbi:MAG: 50S ribosomal protein L11 methyltransferase [Eubacteriales bacterium]|nr:50S ribosomal protein L11 methyltransferase [Eubacteriales bacterium]
MKWRKYTINTTTEAEDMISLMLSENGVEGVQIEDKVPLSDSDTKGMFIDILPDIGEDDGTARLSFFLHLYEDGDAARENSADPAGADLSYTIADRLWKEEEIEELLNTVRAELDEMRTYMNIGEGSIEIGTTEDTDWRNSWKQYFKPIRTGGFLIKPSWEEIPEETAEEFAEGALKVIEIDPGTAFGTGSHETTRLCLGAVEKYVSHGDTVLDIGTGSGILAIAAISCGAKMAAATELDEMCEPSIRDNAGYNGITDGRFELIMGNIIGDDKVRDSVRERSPEGYDVVIANILAPVIVMLASAGVTDVFCKRGGIFITSGIIDTKLQEVISAFEANPAWEILEVNTLGEWAGVTAKRV